MTPRPFSIWGLRATAVATTMTALLTLIGAANAPTSEAPSSGYPLTVAGIALLAAAVLMATSKRPDLVELILAGLAVGAFGVVTAEIDAMTAASPDHYGSLWMPITLGALLIAFRAFGRRPAQEVIQPTVQQGSQEPGPAPVAAPVPVTRKRTRAATRPR